MYIFIYYISYIIYYIILYHIHIYIYISNNVGLAGPAGFAQTFRSLPLQYNAATAISSRAKRTFGATNHAPAPSLAPAILLQRPWALQLLLPGFCNSPVTFPDAATGASAATPRNDWTDRKGAFPRSAPLDATDRCPRPPILPMQRPSPL